MKVLFAIHSLSGGGAERQLSYLSEILVTSGIELNVVFRETGPLGDKVYIPGVKYTQLRTQGNYNFRVIPELFGILKEFKPDIVQSWINQFDILVGIVRLFSRFKWISREANAGSNHKGFKNKWLRESLLSRVDTIVANSPGGYSYWKDKLNSFLILNGFKTENSEVALDTPELEADENFILYVGRLVKQKNVDALIKGFELAKMSRDFKLVICGEGQMEGEIRELVTQNELGDRVMMLGYLPANRVKALMTKAKALCLLSDYEGMPNVVFESMMVNTQVLLSSTKSHRALFYEDCVVYVDKSDLESIAHSLDEIAAGEINVEMVKNAKEFVSSCSVEQMGRKYIELYKGLC